MQFSCFFLIAVERYIKKQLETPVSVFYSHFGTVRGLLSRSRHHVSVASRLLSFPVPLFCLPRSQSIRASVYWDVCSPSSDVFRRRRTFSNSNNGGNKSTGNQVNTGDH